MKLHLTSLGCAKNQVDSELMLGRFVQSGWSITDRPAEADVIVVNTCSFIESAIDESIDTILALAQYKNHGNCRRLIVTGCLPERFKDRLIETLPEVDAFLGTGAFDQILPAAQGKLVRACVLADPNAITLQRYDDSRISSASHLAYLKIAEGCNRHCTYCIIPKLRGLQRSRTIDDIVSEASNLAASGSRELVLVAQDTTSYGQDLVPPAELSLLLKRLARSVGQTWIRLLYGHPESFKDSVIDVVTRYPNLCSYFDLPIQHASDRILTRMGRHYTRRDLLDLFKRIRTRIPDAVLRTTVIVGFPGETDSDVKRLADFIQRVKFEHLGVFMYSDAEDLPSHNLPAPVDPEIARKRYDQLMSLQVGISQAHNRRYIGKTCRVLVEEKLEDDLYAARTQFQAPEVDGLTFVRAENLNIGTFYNVTIQDAMEYDLVGEPA